MTNELAIRILTGDVLGTKEQTQEAITMAVKALSLPSAQQENTCENTCEIARTSNDCISRQAAIDAWRADFKGYVDCLDLPRDDYNGIMEYIDEAPSAQPEITLEIAIDYLHKIGWMQEHDRILTESAQSDSFVDADKLKRCRFEYINACKIVAHPTPDTSKSDIYDAHALIKALHPIFGDVEF